jgi:AhpD family alkylhydroperoxidase
MSDTQRLDIHGVDPDAYQAVLGLQKYVNAGRLTEQLLTLVTSRASQINHCAWCLDMHTVEARTAGVDQRKLDVLAAWREAPALFSEAERAALAFTEEVTLISDGGVTDTTWQQVRAAFDEAETVRLLMAIATINVWNRMNVAARTDLPPRREPR